MSVRILVTDDHPVVRAGLSGMLSGEPDFEVVGEAQNGKEAVAFVGELKPDVVLMDLRMPEMDGVTAIGRIKSDHPDVHILVLTTYETDRDVLPAIKAGATGYLLKDATQEELFRAVGAAVRGESVLSPSVAARRLFISEASVKAHLLHVYAKLGVNDRAAAVATAYDRGLLTPGG